MHMLQVSVQGRQYAFDCVVGEGGHSRPHMCEQYIRPLVRNVCNGVNCAVLAYGQTSSGKTYTMGIGKEQLQALSCGEDDAVGDLVIPYALRQLFANVEAARGKRTFTLLVSFVEVYMEKYYDLLSQRQPVAAKTKCDGEVMLVGAQLRQVDNMEDVIHLLQIGGLARSTKGTNQNDRSSRSHAVLTIHVQSRAAADPSPTASGTTSALCSPGPARAAAAASCASSGSPNAAEQPAPTPLAAPPVRACAAVDSGSGGAALSAAMAAPPLAAKLHLVDLAGSESVGRAGTVGLAAKEGNTINLSLMTLRNLIQLLAAPKAAAKVVLPYRDSKLTTLLREALGGNSSTLFVACVSPADANAAMTVSTLEFATTARRIRTKPAVNIGGAGSAEVLELHRIILKLRNELEQLRRQVATCSHSPQRSPRRVSMARTSMSFAAAVAAASMQPSMQTPSPALLAGGSPSPAVPSLIHFHQQQQLSYLMSTLSAGRRSSVATANGTPPPMPIRMSTNGMIMSSAASVLGNPGSVVAATVPVGRTTSPGAAQAWAGPDSRCSPATQQAQQVPACGSTAEPGEPVDGQGGRSDPSPERSETGDVAAAAGVADGKVSFGGALDNKPSYAARPGQLRDRGAFGKAGRVMRSRSRRRGKAGRRRGSNHEAEHDDDGHSTSGSDSAGDGGRSRRRLRRSHPASSADPSDSDGGSNSLLSASSYSEDSGASHDEWHGAAELQQRIVLLEAENEHLQKHVGHLSVVIAELRVQLDAQGARMGSASVTPLSITPSVARPIRSSASGASLFGQSMLTATSTRLQRTGASVGGVSRMSRTPFSPSQQLDSPYSAMQRPSPAWDPAVRMSCGEGTPPGGYYGQRRTGMGPTLHEEFSMRPQDHPLLMPRVSRPGGADGFRVESPFALSQRRYTSDNGVAAASTTSPYTALAAQQYGALATPESCGGAATARASAVASPAALAPSAAAAGWQATDAAAAEVPALAESMSPGCGGTLSQVVEEEGEEVETSTPAVAVACNDAVEAEASAGAGVALVLSDEETAEQPAESPAQPSSAADTATPVALEVGENRMLAMLTWIGQRVADSESLLAAQQATLRKLLAQQGLTVGAADDELPSLDTLQGFASTQLAGVEAELSGLDVCNRKGSFTANSSPSEAAPVPSVDAGVALTPAPQSDDDASDSARRVEELRARKEILQDLQVGLTRVAELEASLELQREMQMLVAVYAGLSSSDDLGVATGPAVARAAAAAELQLSSLRRHRRQQIIKDAAVAREKLRELETLSGPPTALEFGVLLQMAGSGSSGGGSATPGPSGPPSSTGAASWLAWGGIAAGGGQFSLDAGEDDDVELQLERTSGTATPKAGVAAGSSGSGFAGPVATATPQPLPPPPPPLPSLPPQPQQQTPSLLSQFLPVQVGQVGPWLDALLDYETRLQQYNRVLAGALQEREAVYGQLQDVEQELAILAEEAAADALVAVGSSPEAATGWRIGTSPSQGGNNRNGRTDGGASFAGWMSSPMRAVLRDADMSVQQHAAALSARQAKLQERLEVLCMEVASLQPAIVEAQESRSAATERDDWWVCVPSLDLARPALRLLLERAAEYRAAFLDTIARTDKLEQQVEELGLQYQEAEARLAAHSLELMATRAAALAAVAGPGLNQSFSDAVAVLLRQPGGGGTGGGFSTGDGSSSLASSSTQRSQSTCLAAEALGAPVLGAAGGHSTAGAPDTPSAEVGAAGASATQTAAPAGTSC
ncbi:hypothetical protein PLESTF_001353600 [Pleodorina starrii]|nr:hypothetical protein PLESTF_001353600 [Pleodorina starrii]